MNSQKLIRLCGLFSLTSFLCLSAQADSEKKSGRTSILDNPYVVIAQNPKNKVVSGYVMALRTSPDRTDECKFVFQGHSTANGISDLLIADAVVTPMTTTVVPDTLVHGALKRNGETDLVVVNQADKLGNCDWILGFIGQPAVIVHEKQLEIPFKMVEGGSWMEVNVIRAKRAYFHAQPNETSKGKAFIVAGDLIYIYDENQDWYYAKYQSGKNKETTGWIRKTDTIQFPERR